MSEQYEISIVFGGDKEASINKTFQTQREMHAYFCALHDFDGWLDYTYVEDGIDGWVKNQDGTWKWYDSNEVVIETYNQKSVSYPEFAKEQNDL